MNELARTPVMERLVPSVSEEALQPLVKYVSSLETGEKIKWEELKNLARWPAPETEVEDALQQTRHTMLVEGINRHAGKAGNGNRFQLRVIRGSGVEVLRGDNILDYRRSFEIEKVKSATKTAAKRLHRELEEHQENMTGLGRYQANRTHRVFEKMMERAVEDLKELLEELAVIKTHWKNGL